MEKGCLSAESAYQQHHHTSIRSSTFTVYGRTVGHGQTNDRSLTKEAISLETEAFRQFFKLQILKPSEKLDCHVQFAVKYPMQLSDWEHTHTHTHTNY